MKGIYEIRNIENGKRYVGSSKDIETRWEKHKQKLRANKHSNPHLQNAWNIYGEESFNFQVLEEQINEENLKTKEKEYLDKFESYEEENGYNISQDPEGGDTLTGHPDYDEIIRSMSESSSGESNGFYGMSHTEEVINQLSLNNKGKNNPMHGKSHDEESIQKMKKQADNRYTLEWFQEVYGEEEGRRRYEERCERRSEYMKENNPMEDEENREKVSEALSGKEKSEEHKKKISESRKGKGTGSNNVNYVHVPKEELKQKIQEGLVSKELADYFDTSQNTITRKVNKYWGEGLRSVRSKVTNE